MEKHLQPQKSTWFCNNGLFPDLRLRSCLQKQTVIEQYTSMRMTSNIPSLLYVNNSSWLTDSKLVPVFRRKNNWHFTFYFSSAKFGSSLKSSRPSPPKTWRDSAYLYFTTVGDLGTKCCFESMIFLRKNGWSLAKTACWMLSTRRLPVIFWNYMYNEHALLSLLLTIHM